MTLAQELAAAQTRREVAAEARALSLVKRPTFTVEAAAMVRAHIRLAYDRECWFGCTWDAAEQSITEAPLLMRGRSDEVRPVGLEPGLLLLHNHPRTTSEADLTPSPEDLKTAAYLWDQRLGMALCTNDARGLYVLIEPRPITLRAVSYRATRLGPFTLVREPGMLQLSWKVRR